MSYTVMIVDDERPARELLKIRIDWALCGFKLVAEAKNGREALERYQELKPDLIITDIQMPAMDGIELIQEVRKLDKKQRFVILSCHESFEYAREAIRLGVIDYLIKDAINAETVTDMMRRIAQGLGKNPKEKKRGSLERLANDGDITIPTDALPLNWVLEDGFCYFAVYLFPETEAAIAQKQQEPIRRLLSASAASQDESIRCYPLDKGALLVFYSMPQTSSTSDRIAMRFELIARLRQKVGEVCGEAVTVGVSRVCTQMEQFSACAQEAQHAARYRVFLGKGRTHFFDAIQDQYHTAQSDAMESRFAAIRKHLSQGECDKLLEEITVLYEKEVKGMLQFNYLQHVNSVLLDMLLEQCVIHGLMPEEVINAREAALDVMAKHETVSEVCGWFTSCYRRLMEMQEQPPQYSLRTERVMRYIRENYQSDISLSSIADEFMVHKVHLARVFKEETNKNINAYIIELRLGKAKLLLRSTDLRVGEVQDMSGFNNPQNFYTLFKKNVGCSPAEYRKNKGVLCVD